MLELLCVATNMGGVNNVIPICERALAVGHSASIVASEITAGRFRSSGLEPLQFFNPALEPEYCSFELDHFNAFVLGTTRFPGPENFFIQAGVEKNIPVIVLMDERYRFIDRFRLTKGGYCFPDALCVMDSFSRNLAIEEGVPKDIVHVTGSPSIELLSRKYAVCEAESTGDWPESSKGSFRILFVSESHSEDYGDAPNRSGMHGDYLGYTELDVRADLFNVLLGLTGRFDVVEKLHPDSDLIPEPFVNPTVQWTVVKNDIPLHRLITAADLVVGMRSFVLLESAVMGARVISYQPNLIGRNDCAAVNLGFVSHVGHQLKLHDLIRDAMMNSSDGAKAIEANFLFEGATKRVFEVIMKSINGR